MLVCPCQEIAREAFCRSTMLKHEHSERVTILQGIRHEHISLCVRNIRRGTETYGNFYLHINCWEFIATDLYR